MTDKTSSNAEQVLRIGRAPDNDLVVPDPMVSKYHAVLRQTAEGEPEIADLDSSNGTYVNGHQVARHVLGPRDAVVIGHSRLHLTDGRLVRADAGSGSFTARDLTVRVRQRGEAKTLLSQVSLDLPEKSLVGIVGPSGCGKSTLLRALTGYQPADEGEVLYDGLDLYTHFAELRQRVALVPQDDVLHPQLTLRKALSYGAKLRFPRDTDAAAREERVREVLEELGLSDRMDTRITALSGGQRKRVSVAMELLTKPALLLLDEPTSGLDPGLDRQVMQMLRGLADGGRRVAVVTHSVANLHLCDRLLVLAPGGRTAYFGPSHYALEFFGHDDWADVFQDFDLHPDRDWAASYRDSIHHHTYAAVMEELAAQGTDAPDDGAQGENSDAEDPERQKKMKKPRKPRKPRKRPKAGRGPRESSGAPSVRPPSWRSQFTTLMRRNFSVIAADRGHAGLLLALPLIMGVLSVTVPAQYGFMAAAHTCVRSASCVPNYNVDAQPVLLVLAVGACLTGTANSVRELVQERVVYQRERAIGLSRSAYVLSKVMVLGLITAVQGFVVVAIGLAGRRLPVAGLVTTPSEIELILVVVLLSTTSMMLGLIISALVRTAEKTMPLLVLATVGQVMFSGAVFPLFNQMGLNQLSWLAPSRWAVAAQAATIDLGRIGPPTDDVHPHSVDPLWAHTAHQWWLDSGVLEGLGLVGIVVVLVLLRRHEPLVMRRG
ncbi:ATP-binding cassette domain-containing protein [Streptomyces monashensis]|uniref:ATP-binding cassette domain-containing protein n=1 Tax=Streptomyces monashensis TaxID=1678012 RepID=UPI0033D0AC7E